MTIGIMQPYLFPYIGYFQLINAVDKFVIYDDVQYIKNGWINRNRICFSGKPRYFTLGVKKAPFTLPINKRFFSDNVAEDKNKFLSQLNSAYRRSSHFRETVTLVERIMAYSDPNIAEFVGKSLNDVCKYLGINTTIVRSSELKLSAGLRGRDRVIQVCRLLKATRYVNAIGGKKLYDKDYFHRKGIDLCFLQCLDTSGNLSIIDVLMNNSVDRVKQLLTRYEFV